MARPGRPGTLGHRRPRAVGARRGRARPRLARDLPFERGQRGVLAHRQPGARLAVLRDGRDEVLRAHLGEGGQPALHGLGAVGLEQDLPQSLADGDRRIGGGVGPAGDADLDRPERDLVGDGDRGLKSRVARLLDVLGGRLRRDLPSTASRVRLKSRLCLSTAPAATSPSRSLARPNRSASPSSAAVSISWLVASRMRCSSGRRECGSHRGRRLVERGSPCRAS